MAASYYGVSIVGEAIRRSKYGNGGDFPDFLLTLTLKAFYRSFGKKKIDCLAFVPPTVSGKLVENFASKMAGALRLPLLDGLVKNRTTETQKKFHNSYLKRDNVADAFSYAGDFDLRE